MMNREIKRGFDVVLYKLWQLPTLWSSSVSVLAALRGWSK